MNRIGARGHLTHYFCLMAEGLLPGGRYLEGLSHVTRALALAAEIEERWYAPRLHRVRGELLLYLDGSAEDAVEASFRQAVAVRAPTEGQRMGIPGGHEPRSAANVAAAVRLANFLHRSATGSLGASICPICERRGGRLNALG